MHIFPVEIRLLVYAECVKIRALGLLYANKKFHNEFLPFLREKFKLGFHIDPAASPTVVKLINPDDSPWGNACDIDAASSHPNYHILDRMPLHRFGGIRILVDAPDPRDPGQLVRGWLQANRLVTLLVPRSRDLGLLPRHETDFYLPPTRSSNHLPAITINVRDSEVRRWSDGQAWNRSVPGYGAWNPVTRTAAIARKGANSDLQIILTPFARVRRADAMFVIIPDNAPSESVMRTFLDWLVRAGTRPIPFPLDIRSGAILDDDDVLAVEDAMHVWLDYLLDDMEGPTAAMLRRDRFQSWCAEYEYRMGQHFHGFATEGGRAVGGAQSFMHDDLFELITHTWHDRFMSAREHVIAAYRDALRRQGHTVYVSRHREVAFWLFSRELRELGLLDGIGEEDTFWETCYPHGIAPKSRNDSWGDTADIFPPPQFRLEPPDRLDMSACHTFPAFIYPCSICNCDYLNVLLTTQLQQPLRDFLLRFYPQPGESRWLGPLE